MTAPHHIVRVPLVLVAVLAMACPVSPSLNDDDDTAKGEGEGDVAEGEGEGDVAEGEGEGDVAEGEGEGEVRWFRDVIPIARRHCAACHVEGGVAPFAIEDLDAVIERQDLIPEYVESGLMPPWMPSDDCGPAGAPHRYRGDRTMTDAESDIFSRWRDDGFIFGDPAQASGTVPGAAGLLSVDLALQPSQAYVPDEALGGDDYHCFLLDPQLNEQTFVTGYDIAPDARAIVHHVLLYAVDRAAALQHESDTSGFGWTCFGGPDIDNGNGFPNTLGAWAPGSDATLFPVGTGIALSSDDVIVMQVHYNIAHVELPPPPDRTSVQLQLADVVATEALLLPVANADFSLPPQVETTDTRVVPGGGLSVWGVLPHMHQLGLKISLTASTRGCLIEIPAWDFQWQQSYFFDDVDFVQLGTFEQVTLSCTWFNSTGNTVTWGESTSDEMCLAYAYTTQ